MDILSVMLSALMPTLLEILAVVIAGVVLRLSLYAKKYFGVEISARHREAFQSALLTGAQMALSKGLSGSAAIKVILDHVTGAGAKEAVEALIKSNDLTPEKLKELANAKFEKVVADQTQKVTQATVDVLTKQLKDLGVPGILK